MVGVSVQGFEEVDFFNTMGIEPSIAIRDLADLHIRRRLVLTRIHPSHLRGAPPPPHTYLAQLNAFAEYLEEHQEQEAAFFRELNRRGRTGCHTTMRLGSLTKPCQSSCGRSGD